uniref:Bardet-Biedl syndrome 7 n=2 Tax=Plectus sambesii TaxID=2011161 RepID=A0A914XPM1_9BILA
MPLEIPLSRVDYAQVGTTSKGCLRLLTATGEKEKGIDRVVVGSHSGVVLCLGRKKSDTHVVFKTLPGPKIECVQLGGALGTSQDKIFVAAGNTIKGFSKKGKQFFAFETNMTEPVCSMYIYGVDMFLCGRNTFNHYHDCADTNYYLCGDKINDVLCLPIMEGSWVGRGLTPVIACDDRTIKVLDGSLLSYQVELGGIPNILHLFLNNGGHQGQLVLYGTKDGRIGLVDLPVKNGMVRWETITQSSSAVTTMHCYPLTRQGGLDLVIGKDDGLIEIYNIDDQDRVTLRQTYQCDESITGLQCGRVSAGSFDEIIVCTYTGWLFGLTTEPVQKQIAQDQQFSLHPDMEVKVQQLKLELDDLQNRVAEEREKYHEMTLKDNSDGLSAVPLFAINDRFVLTKEEAAYTLSIELIVPIDYILLQCDVPVDLLDVDKNSAVVSLTQCEPNSGNALLATYRCQANTTRLEMKIRSIEGQYGTLQAYVSPKTHPKICQVRFYPVDESVSLLSAALRAMRCSFVGLSVFVSFVLYTSVALANPAFFSSQTLRHLNVGSDNYPKSNDQQPLLWKRSEGIDCESGLRFSEHQWRQCMLYLNNVRISMVGRIPDELRANTCVSWLCANSSE